jgi:hypothetical protein
MLSLSFCSILTHYIVKPRYDLFLHYDSYQLANDTLGPLGFDILVNYLRFIDSKSAPSLILPQDEAPSLLLLLMEIIFQKFQILFTILDEN